MPALSTCTLEALPTDEMRSHRLAIGGIVMTLEGLGAQDFHLSAALTKFQTQKCDIDIRVKVNWSEFLTPFSERMKFDSGAVWKLFRDDDHFIFDFSSPAVGPHPFKRLRVDRSFRQAELTLSRKMIGSYREFYPLEYPADELLFTNYLGFHGLGVEVHGCGLVDPQTGGHLLLGHSGAGKSTTARLWESARSPVILSDDRVILRIEDGELWMYGTPWHGEAGFASAGKAKLERILILQHGEQNEMLLLPRARAVGEIFARAFPPFHSAVGLERTLEFLGRVAQAVPCYEFRFLPDPSAVAAVLSLQ